MHDYIMVITANKMYVDINISLHMRTYIYIYIYIYIYKLYM